MADQYYITAGVRQSVAVREAGITDIPAVIYIGGQPPILTWLALDQLHSPKPVILRDSRYIVHTEYPTCVLKTTPPPIEVEPLGLPNQTASVPLSQVRIV